MTITSYLTVQAPNNGNIFTYNPFAVNANIQTQTLKFSFDYVPDQIYTPSGFALDPNDTPPDNLSVYMAYTLSGSTYAAASSTYDYPTRGMIYGSATSNGSVTIDGNTLTIPSADAMYPASAVSHSASQDYGQVYTLPFTSGHTDLPIATSASVATQGSKAASGNASTSANARPLPIRLTSPNPKGHPQKGDGTNQFAYNDSIGLGPQKDFANGDLFLPITTTLINGTAAETLEVKPRLDWTTDIAGTTAQLLYAVTAAGNTIIPSTTYGPQPLLPRIGFDFRTLPTQNSNFGDHLVTQIVDGKKSDVAHIETFFQGDAINYPGNLPAPTFHNDDGTTDPNPASPPNFWYYYNQVFSKPANSFYTYHGNTRTDPASLQIYLNYDAWIPFSMPVFKLNAGKIQWIGQLKFTGIYTYIYCCGHESAHRAHLQAGIETGGLHTDSTQEDYISDHDPTGGYVVQGGGDGVSDVYEGIHHLNPQLSDTTGAYRLTGEASTGDAELLADIDALGVLIANKALWKQDWAEPKGCRWGKLPWPMNKPQWTFTPISGIDLDNNIMYGPGTPDLPADVLTNISQLD